MQYVQRYLDKYQWHDWFAWYPVKVKLPNGLKGNTYLFWEKVARKMVLNYNGGACSGQWKYVYKKLVDLDA